jgi:prohibitin 2
MAGVNPQNLAQALTNAYKMARVALVGGALVYGASNSLFTVEGGHRAVVFNRVLGIKEDIYEEGMHLMVPWFERPIMYDVRAKPVTIQSVSGSKDLQSVNIGIRVLTRPNPGKLPEIYRTLGLEFAERVLPSIIQVCLQCVVHGCLGVCYEEKGGLKFMVGCGRPRSPCS